MAFSDKSAFGLSSPVSSEYIDALNFYSLGIDNEDPRHTYYSKWRSVRAAHDEDETVGRSKSNKHLLLAEAEEDKQA